MKIHSIIDIITNSSSELFIDGISGKCEEEIQKLIDEIISEIGCDAIDFFIRESEDCETGDMIDGVYDIYYDFECGHGPCKYVKDKMFKVFGVSND